MESITQFGNGIKVIEAGFLRKTEALLNKETKELLVGNMYPFIFIGCGKTSTLEQCVDYACRYAMDKIIKKINSQNQTAPTDSGDE